MDIIEVKNLRFSYDGVKMILDEENRKGTMELMKKLRDMGKTIITVEHDHRLIELAAVLAMKPEYLILDEPTASLDTKRRQVLGQLLRSLECGVMVISHDDGFISSYCDEKVEMVSRNE